ncbi:MAG: M20/M25/M40 family metallo-hydrolase, partial [Dehalococcoidia bacterium]
MISKEHALQTFLELVQIDSPSGEEGAIAAHLVERFTVLGGEARQDAHGNVLATFVGTGEPLLLSAHMDTVQPGRGIRPIIDGERVHTDGSTILGSDPKAGVSAILEGIATVRQSGTPHRALQVIITRGEELGLEGSRNLDYSLVTAKQGFVFDGEGPVSRITSVAPSQYSIEATIVGRAAHAGAEPEKGISAIRIAAELISSLPQGRLDPETTANVGMIEGGTARNAVPERCWFKGEFRSRSRERLEEVRQEIEALTHESQARHPDARVDVQLINVYDGYVLSEDHPALGLARRA